MLKVISLIFALLTSSVLGLLIIWLIIDKYYWDNYLKKKGIKPPNQRDSTKGLTIWLGIVERALYTIATIFVGMEWVAIWLAFKVAASWNSRKLRDATTAVINVYLLGNALSVFFGYLGALVYHWIMQYGMNLFK